jgi:hypothetical protein
MVHFLVMSWKNGEAEQIFFFYYIYFFHSSLLASFLACFFIDTVPNFDKLLILSSPVFIINSALYKTAIINTVTLH